MSYPDNFSRAFDFQSYQNANPTRPLPGDKVNTELDAVHIALGDVIDFLEGLARSDGKLANGSVGLDQLDASVTIGFSLPTTWASGVAYVVTSTVFYQNRFYKCNTAHTSGANFDSAKFDVIADFGALADSAASSATNASASATAAASSASSASTSATNAAASATAASGSASSASTSATNASNSASAASTSATNASNSASAASTSASNASTSATNSATSATTAAAAVGAVAFKYTWSTSTAGDPGPGRIAVNNASPGSATGAQISETDADGNGLSAEIARWAAATSSNGRSRIKIAKNATNYLLVTVNSALTDNGAWDNFTVTGASLVGTIANGDTVYVQAVVNGNDGSGSVSGMTAGQLAVAGGATSVTSSVAFGSAATASTVASRDANANSFFNNLLEGYTTTATAAGTTTLTVASAWQQFFTGTTTQTVVLPVTSTLTLGHSFMIENNSTGAVTVNSSGGNAVIVLPAGTTAIVVCVLTSGTTAASWVAIYSPVVGVSGKALTVNNTLTLAGTDGTTFTFPGTSSTVVTTGNTANFTKGVTVSPNLIGTVSSGTTTLDPTAGNYQAVINGGAFTLAPPALGTYWAIDLDVINGPSAGAITLSTTKWQVGSSTGSSFATTVRATATATITIASPGVVSWTGHGCADGAPVWLTTTGALPTGLSVNTVYYIKYVDANSFQLAATPGGASINTSGTQSGTHTINAASVYVFSARSGYGAPTYSFYAKQ